MKPRLIYVVGGSVRYMNWTKCELTTTMKLADVVMFTGGEDVCPDIYKEQKHPATFCNPERDAYEINEFGRAREMKKPLIGICRGAQFLCVMAGGKLIQHQKNHHAFHEVSTYDGKEIMVTSDHHQAQYPWDNEGLKWQMLAWTIGFSPYHLDGNGKELVNGMGVNGSPLQEIEMAYYGDINALCIQSHPEWVFETSGDDPERRAYIEYCQSLLDMQLESKL